MIPRRKICRLSLCWEN
uniref:Uncharacterized protein n=1 Tax=Arundo donax TaxID=35708 RepID=A0A0A9CI69_ARUDO